MAYKTHVCIRHAPTLAGQIKKTPKNNKVHDEINIMNITKEVLVV